MLKLKQIDARGLSCPQPVLLTKKAVADNPKEICIIVDNTTAKNNVERFLKSFNYSVKAEEKISDIYVIGEK